MEMKIGIVGFGVGIPRTSLGVGFLNIGMIYLRANKYAKESVLQIRDLISVGQKSGTILAAGVETDWFRLDPKKDSWAYDVFSLVGKTVEMEINGIQLVKGKADISVKFFDKYNQAKTLVSQCCIKTSGSQFSLIKIRGVVKKGSLDSKRKKVA